MQCPWIPARSSNFRLSPFWLACFCASWGYLARGELLVEEHFSAGKAGEPLVGKTGGTGFAAAWASGPTAGSNLVYVPQGAWDYYPVNSRLGEPQGGAARLTNSASPNQVSRRLSHPITVEARAQFYLSFIVRDFAANPDNECALGFSQGPGGVQLQIGWRFSDRFGAGLTRAHELLYQTPTNARVEEASSRRGNTTWLVVGQLTSSAEGSATLRVKVYSSAEDGVHLEPGTLASIGPGPDQWTLSYELGRTNLVFDRLTLNMAGWNAPTIDEVRVGTTWADVVGPHDPSILAYRRYHGLRADDPDSLTSLLNPERGYRHELAFALGRGEVIAYGPGGVPLSRTNVLDQPLPPGWGSWAHTLFGARDGQRGYSDAHVIQALRDWKAYGTTIFQGYCYLDPWIDQPLPQEMLDRLTASCAALRASGYKVLLRFAYEKDVSRTVGPSPSTILGHVRQLAPVLRANADVIYVLQEGLIGAWGEGHNSAIPPTWKDRNDILAAVLEAWPPDRMTMVRVTPYKDAFLSSNSLPRLTAALAFTTNACARVGFHNDGFMAGPTDGSTFAKAAPGDRDFDYWTRDSAWVPVDGELFWSDQSWPDGTVSVNGWAAAQRLRLHHFTTFSLAHSSSVYESRPLSMDAWKTQAVTRVMAEAANMPVSDGYFQNTDGTEVSRSAFDYIRDHLGYRVELASAAFPAAVNTTNAFELEVRLFNRGFSTFINPRPVWLVLLDNSGAVALESPLGIDARDWQPWTPGDKQYPVPVHRLKARLNLPAQLRPGSYRLALWLPDGSETLRRTSAYAVRCANGDVPWLVTPDQRHGLNLLGEISVKNSRFADWQQLSFTPDELGDPTVSGPEADPDQDWAGNWEEFIAATSPRDAQSKPALTIERSGDSVVVSFPAAEGRWYQLQERGSSIGDWQMSPDLLTPGVDGVISYQLPISEAARVYRIQIRPW